MKVKLAKTAGFCMGVRRAMEMVLSAANRTEGPLYTFGPLIHNTQVLDLLKTKGITELPDLPDTLSGTIVIRAHGIPPDQRQAIKATGLHIIDATCPRVARVQAIIRSQTRKGSTGIIVGDRDHPEVIGLKGYSEGPIHVIQAPTDVANLPPLPHPFIVAQTTQNEQNFHKVVDALKVRFPDILVFDTICDATHQRQQEVRAFRGHADAIVVVGGYHSGNTQRLVEVAGETGLPSFHVETEKELDREPLSELEVIGVTAGASTPNWMIRNVVREIERIRSRRESPLFRWMRPTFKFLVLSNLLVALGASCFAYGISNLTGRGGGLLFPSVTFLYIYAMHVLNRLFDKGASAYNDPERSAFLRKHRFFLILSGVLAIGAALVLCTTTGMITFFALCGFSLVGIIYSIQLFPEPLRQKTTYSKIKDIPGSKSLSEALAWTAVIAVLPFLEAHQVVWPTTTIAILIVLSISYIRSALFDIFQAQGDLIVGTETLPILLGEKKTLFLLKILLLCAAVILLGSPLFGLVTDYSYWMLLPLLTLGSCVLAYEKHWLYPGTNLEALVEGNFVLAGILAIIWEALP